MITKNKKEYFLLPAILICFIGLSHSIGRAMIVKREIIQLEQRVDSLENTTVILGSRIKVLIRKPLLHNTAWLLSQQ